MSWYNPKNWFKQEKINEEIKAFKNIGEKPLNSTKLKNQSGEGVSDINFLANVNAYDKTTLQSFKMFNKHYIDPIRQNKVQQIQTFRTISNMTEIGDVIEDAINESTQEDHNGNIFNLKIIDDKISKNENIKNNLKLEFNKLFHNSIKLNDEIWNLFHIFYVDNEVFYERINNQVNKKDGIIGIKILPTETMDYFYNPLTKKIDYYLQYLKPKKTTPKSLEEAKKDPDIVVFYPSQIGHIKYGKQAYLYKVQVPYNQIKLLETSIIIYRVIRAPERLVFKIDTGSMPQDKSMRFVEKIKQSMNQKKVYNPETGSLSNDTDISSVLENYFLPQSADGRGSDISSIGGNFDGFSNLDDIYYFQRKLYKALKYPQSRVQLVQQQQSNDVFIGGRSGEINRDEIKWARFLEKQQNKICKELLDLFLLHLELKGLKQQYGLDKNKIDIQMNKPNNYQYQIEQNILETQMNNYSTLSNNPEFSKTFLMKQYLNYTEEEIKQNSDGFKDDEKYLPSTDDGY